MEKQFSIGIDLGTSNSVVAVSLVDAEDVAVLDVTQITGPEVCGEKKSLPSALYISASAEFPPKAFNLPWNDEAEEKAFAVGAFAREHGAQVPDRLVSSSKSWLCNSHVDRRAPVLPWKSELTEEKYSPVDAAVRFLEHLKENLEYQNEAFGQELSLENSQVVLAVPASFDEVARSLTHEAAEKAGWGKVTLLEEPQAAFYSWVADSDGSWREQIKPGDIVLVCDLGGGTADFSLIAVSEHNGTLELNRISVGDHILLGGDNMDLALAFASRAKLEDEGHTIDDWQFLALTHAARSAKESLLSDQSLSEVPISVPGRGASLFASTVSSKITREEVEAIVLEGFLPITSSSELPAERQSVGLKEFGLPYASDPALSKHLARFLRDSLTNVRSDGSLSDLLKDRVNLEHDSFVRPTAVLFNGGVFNAPMIRQRVLMLLNEWCPEQEVVELRGGELDLAVARGASSYGRIACKGEGLRIKAGTSRSYYVGLETSMPAVPGYTPPVKGLCVVPQGTEEGTELALLDNEFGLVTGEPVEFRFFTSTTRAGDEVGAVIQKADRDLEETSRMQITLPALGEKVGEVLPVRLNGIVTELGTLELWMHHTQSDQRWQLDFNLRANQ